MTHPKNLLTPPPTSTRLSLALLALRLVAGSAFVLHGWPKAQEPFSWMGPDSPVPGVLQALAALAEVGGGLAWVLGLLAPVASLGLLVTMTVAAGKHLSQGDPFVGRGGSYELALVYWCVALLLLFGGPGRFSLDARLAGPKNRPRSGGPSLALLAALSLAGCSQATSLLKASPAEPSGYIKEPEKLAPWPRAAFLQGIWFKDREGFYRTRDKYTKIRFRPTRTDFLAERGWWAELNSLDRSGYAGDVEALARRLDEALKQTFAADPTHRFRVVDTADAETVEYEFALTEVVPTKAHLNAVGTAAGMLVPGGGAVKMVAKGSVAVEVKVFDGGSGELIAAWADREHDQASLFSFRDFTPYAHARKAADAWAAELLEAWNRPVEEVVDDRSPFTLDPF